MGYYGASVRLQGGIHGMFTFRFLLDRVTDRLSSRLTRQLVFWMLLTALPSLLMGGWLFSSVYRELIATRQHSAELLARQAMDILDRLVFERYGDTRVFAGLPVVRTLDQARLPDIVDHLVVTYAPYYRMALVVDREGRILAVNRVDGAGHALPTADLIGRSVAEQSWFTRALAATEPVWVEDFHPDPLVEAVYHDQRPVMSFSAPIRNNVGKVVGVWSTRLSLAALEDVLVKAAGASPGSAYPLILRASYPDSVLLRIGIGPQPDAQRLESGRPAPGWRLLAAATSTGFSAAPGLGWRLEIYQPPGALDWPMVLAWLSAWFALLTLGGVICLGVIVHRRVVRPVLALTELVRCQASLARTVPIEPMGISTAPTVSEPLVDALSRADELGDLMRAVGAMRQEVQGQVARLTALNAIGRSLQREMISLPSLLTRIVHTARDLTGARYAALGVFDETGDRLTDLFTAGIDEATKAAIGSLPTGRGLLGHLAKEEGVLRLTDLAQHPAFTGFPPHHPSMSSFMGVSIRAHGQLFGRLYVTNKEDGTRQPAPFTETDEQMLAALAYHAGSVIETTHLLQGIRTAEARYRAILDSVEDGILGVDCSGHCLFVNRAGASRLGYQPDELVGKRLHPLIHPKRADGRPCTEEVCPLLEVGRTAQLRQIEHEALWHRDGTTIPVVCCSVPLYDEEGTVTGVVVSFTDMTERQHLEEQLRQAQKMEAIGRLAGGIAHDFNNILTAILGYSTLLLEQVDQEQRRLVNEIKKAGERAASLTRQILAFSRKQLFAPQVIDLNVVIAGMENLLRRLIGEHIDLLVVPGVGLGRVKVDPSQLEQVIMNLVLNARDAMPDGGRLTIETTNVELSAAYSRTHPEVSPGPYVMLAVSDNGQGMDAPTLARCLEPFFTTKPLGKGSGLGLSTVYGIVKQSGGSLSIYSELGRGTTVKIFLPRVDENLTASTPAQERPLGSRRCTETLLVVEDDEAVRTFAQAVLADCGYTVLVAANGAEAMEISAHHRGWIHLLVTDVVLPDINGRQLVERLRTQRPELKALYISGYTENAVAHQGVLDPGVAFLAKPFTADGLRNKVRETLEM